MRLRETEGRGGLNEVLNQPPNKQETFTQRQLKVGPPSATLAQHSHNLGRMSRVSYPISRVLSLEI